MSEGTVKVLFFGAAQMATGAREEVVMAEDTVSLRRMLILKYPQLARIPFRMALNMTMLREDSVVKQGDIIAILPPFQGG